MSAPARELSIRDYVGVVRRRWRWMVLAPLIVLVVVGGFSLTRQRVYEATAEVLILTDANESIFQTTAATTERLRRNAVAEQQFLSSEDFRSSVGIEADGVQSVTYELGRTDPDQDLADVAILRFVARADTATAASEAANTRAGLYVATRHEQDRARVAEQLAVLEATLARLQGERAETDDQLASLRARLGGVLSDAEEVQLEASIAILEEQQLELAGRVRQTTAETATLEQVASDLDDPLAAARIHNAATTPTEPVSPDTRRNVVLAAIAGLVLGVALAIARDLLDGSARDPVELVRVTGAPVLGAVEANSTESGEAAPAHAHVYQTILKSLALISASPTLRIIGVTSATTSVGKTETVVNLARVAAIAGSRVLVIDGNPISPMVLSRLDPSERREIGIEHALAAAQAATSRDSGGTSYHAWVLSRIATADEGTVIAPRIDVIDLFSSEAATGNLMRGTAMEPVLEKLAQLYELILIDTHAVLSAVGVRPLLTGADGVIVVYDPKRSRVDDLTRTVDLLREGGVNVAGLIANRAPATTPEHP